MLASRASETPPTRRACFPLEGVARVPLSFESTILIRFTAVPLILISCGRLSHVQGRNGCAVLLFPTRVAQMAREFECTAQTHPLYSVFTILGGPQ